MSNSRGLNRAGQSLVEFAVVSLVLYLLLAAILTFGHMLYVAQGLQSAADLAAREISRTALPVTDTGGDYFEFEDALRADDVRLRIYDEAFLVIDLDSFFDNFPPPSNRELSVFQDLAPTLPLLNRQLLPLMIVDTPAGSTTRLLRYPGALLQRTETLVPPGNASITAQGPYESSTSYKPWIATALAVGIPLVVDRTSTGTETIQWLDPIEEIRESGSPSPFSLDSTQAGIVALRLNYPFQSASMSSFQPNPEGPLGPSLVQPNIAANDAIATDSPSSGTVMDLPLSVENSDGEEIYTGTYGGKYGLGAQGAWGQIVRPYRRVITAQAIYRREIFGP